MTLDEFKYRASQETACLVADMHLRAAGVDLSTPGGLDLLRDHVQQQMNTAEIRALKQRLAREEFRARAKAARLSAKRHRWLLSVAEIGLSFRYGGQMFKEIRAWWTVWFGGVPEATEQVNSAEQEEFFARLRKEREANYRALELAEKAAANFLDEDLRSFAREIPWGMSGHDALAEVQKLRNQKRLIDLLGSIHAEATSRKAE